MQSALVSAGGRAGVSTYGRWRGAPLKRKRVSAATGVGGAACRHNDAERQGKQGGGSRVVYLGAPPLPPLSVHSVAAHKITKAILLPERAQTSPDSPTPPGPPAQRREGAQGPVVEVKRVAR